MRSEPERIEEMRRLVDDAVAAEISPVVEAPPVKVERPVNVEAPVTESVPVAVRLAPKTLPEKSPLPCTESVCEGEVVPRPRKPVAVKVEVAVPPKKAWVADSSVVEALPLNCCSTVNIFCVVVPKDVESMLLEYVRPLPIPRVPTTPLLLVERIEESVPTVRPLVALRLPPMVVEPEVKRLLSDARPETEREVLVALVVVPNPTERLEMVEDALTIIPTVVVGVSALLTMFQSL